MPRYTLSSLGSEQTDIWPPAPWPVEPFSDEPARDVYRSSCLAIAQMLSQEHFRYRKSDQRCFRESNGFGHTLRFQSSHNNASGRHVQLWVHATVTSKELQAWRVAHGQAGASDLVAGGMVHLLGTKFAFIEWELANPETRPATILDAVNFIQQEVLPYFSLFENPGALALELSRRVVPAFDLVASIEFSYCFAGKAAAELALEHFLHVRQDLLPQIAAKSSAKPVAAHRPSNYVEQVVYLKAQYELQTGVT